MSSFPSSFPVLISQNTSKLLVTVKRCVETMGTQRIRAIVVALLVVCGAVACGTLPEIATETTYCCRPAVDRVHTYRIEFEDMPEFLKPMLRDEASIVLDTKNLEYTEGQAHAVLKMTFVSKTYAAPRTQREDAWGTIAPGGASHFIAEVQMELRNSVSSELIWAGSMSRVHNVYEGSYMHDAPARAAMRQAFTRLFADLPDPVLDDL